MPTRFIRLFFAIYAAAILEVAQGLGLAHSRSSTSEGWGASCNHQNIACQLLALFLWDVLPGAHNTNYGLLVLQILLSRTCGDYCPFFHLKRSFAP